MTGVDAEDHPCLRGVKREMNATGVVLSSSPNQRCTFEPVETLGTAIQRGSLVLGVLASANHDQTRFAEPETLDLSRSPNPHLTFRQGATTVWVRRWF